MLQIAICDDEMIFAKRTEELISQYANRQNIAIDSTLFYDGTSFLSSSLLADFEVVFLDVDFGQEQDNGITLGKALRKANENVIIIYISSLIEYAPQGYEVQAFRYLLKTTLDETINDCMEALVSQLSLSTEKLKVHKGLDQIELPLASIVYLESWKRKIQVHTKNMNEVSYDFYGTMQDVEQLLSLKGFLRIHKSYLVNMKEISKLKSHQVFLKDGTVLNASERNWKNTISSFLTWKGAI